MKVKNTLGSYQEFKLSILDQLMTKRMVLFSELVANLRYYPRNKASLCKIYLKEVEVIDKEIQLLLIGDKK